ncbi:DegT/DnrJ/EryC1/StrS family aminotransferase [Methylomagnum sp.]
MLPVPGWSAFMGGANPLISSAFQRGPLSFFSFGRYALAEALRRAGVGRETAVLLPALHCRSMVEPALHLDAETRFYPVTADLRPDFAALDALAADGAVRAMLLSHYFGFTNALDEARAFCARHGIALIEDCAHAFFGEHRGQPVGTFGDYAIASAWKFFPVRDGAMLRDNSGGSAAPLGRPPALAELKAGAAGLAQGARRVWRRESLPPIDGEALMARARAVAARLAQAGGGRPGVPTFQPEGVDLAGLRLSRGLVSITATGRLVARRRANYRRWLDGVRDVPGLCPLFPDLPEGVVPYAFPVLADADGLVFHAIKLAGMPLWRWEDMAVTACPVARDYRVRLLQLPCHQAIRPDELDWMLDLVRTVAARVATG